ncbi:MAG TPA: hypothetical protein VIO14_12675 [Dehalococcoidia bacterium]
MTQRPTAPQRVAPMAFPEAYTLPGRPDQSAPPAVQDTYRETQWVLGEDLRLFARAQNLQLAVVRDSYPSRYRSHRLAAAAMLWSRAYLHLSGAVELAVRGQYAACPALVRAACELTAAEIQLHDAELEAYLAWLEEALRPNESLRGTELGLGRYLAGETLASHPRLGPVYRAASELARPHFGVSVLTVAPESNLQRVAVAFADTAFHMGWAQMVLGWCLTLADIQLEFATTAAGTFHVTDEVRAARAALAREIETLLARRDRCSVEEVMVDGERRFVVHNFRRQPRGAPKRFIL